MTASGRSAIVLFVDGAMPPSFLNALTILSGPVIPSQAFDCCVERVERKPNVHERPPPEARISLSDSDSRAPTYFTS